jgi:adenylosuccinate lyase
MRSIWTDENKLKLWLQIELLASEALVKERIVPKKDFAKLKAGCDAWFADLPGLVARQKELEKVLNHDVIGFTTAVAEKINDNASRWFHFGLTSSDVGVGADDDHAGTTLKARSQLSGSRRDCDAVINLARQQSEQE